MTAMGTWFDPPADPQAQWLSILESWADAGWLRPLDAAFARFLAREVPGADPLLLLAAALASHQLGRGHACLDLAAALQSPRRVLALPPEQRAGDTRAQPADTPGSLLAGLDLPRWLAALGDGRLVGPGEGDTPLVLDGARLYLRRYWTHEQTVRAGLAQRLQRDLTPTGAAASALREALDALFVPQTGPEPDWQRAACALAARSAFAVVTGGPGTGKTTTVVKLLAVLQHLALQGLLPGRPQGRALRIRLAAPTGKAAARLNTSIAGAVQSLPLQGLPQAQALRASIPTEVATVHRLLGPRPDSRRFRHDATAPLPLDLLVVDEASMVDLELMAALLQALPPQARLILLGDKDQLASVEAGAVLGALCERADLGRYTPATRDWLQQVAGVELPTELVDPAGQPLDQAVATLRRSWRFRPDGGIGQLAAAVNAGWTEQVERLAMADLPDLAFTTLDPGGRALRALLLEGGTGHFRVAGDEPPAVGHAHALRWLRHRRPPDDADAGRLDHWALQVLEAFNRFQLLAALRSGPCGVEGLNAQAEQLLQAADLIDARHAWYEGRPVMVTRNDYALGLMNGDVGMTLRVPTARGPALRVAFPDGVGGILWALPSRLQDVETVFAMTVHKSQGSEFSHAALVLPDRDSPVLTRELVYTAITRARHWCTLAVPAGAPKVLDGAVRERLRRAGGALD